MLTPGQVCGAGLWRALDERTIEVSHGLRSGQRFTMVLPLAAARQTLVACIRCGTKWWPETAVHPRLIDTEAAAAAIIGTRPQSEILSLREHNSHAHVGEAA